MTSALPVRLVLAVALLLAPAPVLAPGPAAAQEKELMAVLDFDVIGSEREQGAVLTNQLRSELLKTGRFTMVNRAELERILEEQALQQQVCLEKDCAVEVGRILGVRKIVTGQVTKVTDTLWQVSATLTDVETAEIQRQEVVNHAGDFASLFLSGMANVAGKLAATDEELLAGAMRLAPESIAPRVFEVLREAGATAMVFSHDSRRLYYARGERVVAWSIRDREPAGAAVPVPGGRITALAVNRKGDRLAAGNDDGEVALVDLPGRKVLHTARAHSDPVTTLAFSPADNYFASGSEDEEIHVYLVRSGETLFELEGPDDAVATVRFSADGKHLIAASRDRTIRVFDVNVQKEVRAFKESARELLFAEISSDGAYLGVAAKTVDIDLRRNRRLDTELVKIRDVSTGEELLAFEAHEKNITGLAFFPDTRYLATGGQDGRIKIWDLQANATIAALPLQGPVAGLRVSPDGRWLAGSTADGAVTIWEVTR